MKKWLKGVSFWIKDDSNKKQSFDSLSPIEKDKVLKRSAETFSRDFTSTIERLANE